MYSFRIQFFQFEVTLFLAIRLHIYSYLLSEKLNAYIATVRNHDDDRIKQKRIGSSTALTHTSMSLMTEMTMTSIQYLCYHKLIWESLLAKSSTSYYRYANASSISVISDKTFLTSTLCGYTGTPMRPRGGERRSRAAYKPCHT